MIRVVIDTNCLIAAIPTNSVHKWLYDSFVEEAFEWVVSTEILNEYAEKIGDFFSTSTADYVLKSLVNAPNVLLAEPHSDKTVRPVSPARHRRAETANTLPPPRLHPIAGQRYTLLRGAGRQRHQLHPLQIQVLHLRRIQHVIVLTEPEYQPCFSRAGNRMRGADNQVRSRGVLQKRPFRGLTVAEGRAAKHIGLAPGSR